MTSVRRIAAALVLLATTSKAQAAIHFDQLSACDDIARLNDFSRMSLQSCRPPGSEIERRVFDFYAMPSEGQLCILPYSPSRSTTGFTCVTLSKQGVIGAITCFRAASENEIKDYQENSESYQDAVTNYLNLAGHCSVGAGNAAAAPNTELPPIIGAVAQFEFGFIMGIGKALFSRRAVIHGYATVDPALGHSDRALEFLSIFQGEGQ